ncbi:hypothetical protein ACIQUQ_07150 [Streptomyces sp. NPDC101118]|uniref:hypothetical protein n=1 Tax=Streptomyces sp. NPDC101118 TaxID=3366109 RepID=UPI00381349AB
MSSEDERAGEHTGRVRRRPGPVVVAAAATVLLAGGGAWWAAASAGGDPRAALGDTATAARQGAADGSTPPPGIAPGEPDPSGGGVVYVAEGKLPGGPGRAPAYDVTGEVTKQEVARLAAALGIPGEPRLSGEQWQAGVVRDPDGPRLTVTRQAPGTWTYTAYRSGGGDDCQKGKDTCGPVTPPEGDGRSPVGEAAARAAAVPVLKAAGQDGAKLDARQVQGPLRVVNADPVIGGLPTSGWRTTVLVGPDGAVAKADGNLKAPVRNVEQPVVGAQQALDRLNAARSGAEVAGCATPVPDTGAEPGAGSGTDGAVPSVPDPCEPGTALPKQPRRETVERAVLGLTPRSGPGPRQLVPAWLFEVAGRDGGPGHTVAQVALEGEDEVRPGPVGTVPGFSYQEDGRKLTVHFWGGVCSTYAAEVREHPGTVTVKITDTPREPGRACILIAQEMSLTVTLEQPLGGRKVVDATTGKELPRSR